LYSNGIGSVNFCARCFNADKESDKITIYDETDAQQVIRKANFKRIKNNFMPPEQFVNCMLCGRTMHKICVLYVCNQDDDEQFFCNNCNDGVSVPTYNASELSHTNLSHHIENRVNSMLNEKKINCSPITVRNIFSVIKTTTILPHTANWLSLNGYSPVQYQYRAKGIFAFQQHEGADVCIFGMYVQEYTDCPAPNKNCVYINYLDSVNFFKPRNARTEVYQEIMLAYLQHVKALGFKSVHLWSCPPKVGMDYIFYRHPIDQKYPTQSKLNKWYNQLFDIAVERGILSTHCDLLTEVNSRNFNRMQKIRYFEGDFVPEAIEYCVRKNNSNLTEDELLSKIKAVLKKHTHNFFVGTMEGTTVDVIDTDPLKCCNILNDRSELLQYAFNHSLEFSSIRRAKFSTLSILAILFDAESTYICKMCNQLSDFAYQCQECKERTRYEQNYSNI
jgi:E1A/CREB-binding protein